MAVITPPVYPEDAGVAVVRPGYDTLPTHHHHHGVCWRAVIAGALAAAAMSLILLMLGLGLGFSAISPWAHQGADAHTLSVASIVWISLMSLVASGLGGYMTGRLRRRDTAAHLDEEHFRDTANGFLSWALATLLTAGLLSSAIGSLVGGAARVGGAALGGAAMAGMAATAGAAGAMGSRMPGDRGLDDSMGYYVDALFRPSTGSATAATSTPATTPDAALSGGVAPPTSGDAGTDATPSPVAAPTPAPVAGPGTTRGAMSMPTPGAGNGEAARIMANAVSQGSLSPTDRQYLAQLVAQRTGIGQADAQQRVTDAYTRLQNAKQQAEVKAREAADTARKAAESAAGWTFFALLLGAFAASAAALLGSRHVIRQTPVTTTRV